MVIEQVLMRSMKTQGGLTHGRGMSDSVITKFILTMLTLVDVSNEMEQFCNVTYYSSDQHVDANCHEAYQVGIKSVKSLVRKDFETVKFSKKNRILSLKSAQSSI